MQGFSGFKGAEVDILIAAAMAESEEVVQRRREKILSRTTSASSEDDPEFASPAQANVFDRYKLLKEKEANEKQLTFTSRFAGLVILPLCLLVPPWSAYAAVALLLVLRAYLVTRNEVEGGKQFDWLIGKVPLLGKLKHLDRVLLMGKVLLNALLSFIMAAVIANALAHHAFAHHAPVDPSAGLPAGEL